MFGQDPRNLYRVYWHRCTFGRMSSNGLLLLQLEGRSRVRAAESGNSQRLSIPLEEQDRPRAGVILALWRTVNTCDFQEFPATQQGIAFEGLYQNSRRAWRRFKLILASICQVKFHWNVAFPTPHGILTGGGYLPSDRCDYKYCTKPCDKNLTLDVLVRHPQVVKRFPSVYFPTQNQCLGLMLRLSSHSNSIWEEQQLSIRPGP